MQERDVVHPRLIPPMTSPTRCRPWDDVRRPEADAQPAAPPYRGTVRATRPVVWPRRSDWWLPAVLALVAQADVWAPSRWQLGHLVGQPLVVSLLYVVTAAALAWRRLAPVPVLAFIVVADTVEYVVFGAPEGLGSLLPTVVALYAVGRHARPAALTAAGPLALLGTVVHELKDPIFQLTGSDAVFYGVVAAAWPVGYAFRRRAEQAAALRAQRDQAEAQRLVAAEEAAATERARIARELHDIVGHGLSVLVLQQVGAAAALDHDMVADARRLVSDGERVARDTLTEMRRLLTLLGDEPGPAPSRASTTSSGWHATPAQQERG